MCWSILLIFYKFICLLGVVIFRNSLNGFLYSCTNTLLLISHKLTTLPVHSNVKQIEPHLRSALCRCTQFATLSTTALYDRNTEFWAAECGLCRIYLVWNWGNILCTAEWSGDWELHNGTVLTGEFGAVPRDRLNGFIIVY